MFYEYDYKAQFVFNKLILVGTKKLISLLNRLMFYDE